MRNNVRVGSGGDTLLVRFPEGWNGVGGESKVAIPAARRGSRLGISYELYAF